MAIDTATRPDTSPGSTPEPRRRRPGWKTWAAIGVAGAGAVGAGGVLYETQQPSGPTPRTEAPLDGGAPLGSGDLPGKRYTSKEFCGIVAGSTTLKAALEGVAGAPIDQNTCEDPQATSGTGIGQARYVLPGGKVIMVTAGGDPGMARRSVEGGVTDGVLRKIPVTGAGDVYCGPENGTMSFFVGNTPVDVTVQSGPGGGGDPFGCQDGLSDQARLLASTAYKVIDAA